jgi:hypothetical protein
MFLELLSPYFMRQYPGRQGLIFTLKKRQKTIFIFEKSKLMGIIIFKLTVF